MNHAALKAAMFAGLITAQLNIVSAQASTLTTNADWTWMKGANTIGQNGTYGALGVPSPANTPGARFGAVSWTGADGAQWLFGGNGYPASGGNGYLNDLWKYDPATGNWAWMKGTTNVNQNGTYGAQGVPAAGNTPGARYETVSWTGADGAQWLFGGYGYPGSGASGYLNDLWKYDPATMSWTWIKGATNIAQLGIYGTQGVPAAGNRPGARFGAVSWTDDSGAQWLFGGRGYPASGGAGELNDLWKFDPATTNWTWMKGSTNVNQNGIYGTQGVPAAGNTPGARKYAVSWTDGSGAQWLFGGNGYDASGAYGSLNDLWRCDVGGGIALDTHALAFSAIGQGANPVAQVIGMTNVGVTAFTYANMIAYGAGASGWLTVAPAAGTVAFNSATVLTFDVNITGLGVGTYYATNQIAADATNAPQTVVVALTVIGKPNLTGDIDGDGLADLITVVGANWYVWFSSSGYAQRIGPCDLGISGLPATGDMDGDGLADLISVVGSNWYVWFSSSGYAQRIGPCDLGISGTPTTGDLEGDGLADLISVVDTNWYVWFSSSSYAQRIGPCPLIP